MSKYSSARNNAIGIKSTASITSYRPELFDDDPPPNVSHRPPSNLNNNNNHQSHYQSNNNNNNDHDNDDEENSFYGPSRAQPRNNNYNHIKRRVAPPTSVSQSNPPHPYNNSNNNNPSQTSQKPRQNPPSTNYSQPQSPNTSNKNPYAPPPQSRSSQYHQPPYDYPQYVQHELQKEHEQKSANPNRARYAHSEQPQNNYQYQQRHSPNNGRNKARNNNHTQSEQAHYRGPNRRREITADPHSLQRISSKLPKRPGRPFINDANNPSTSKIFPINLKSNSTNIKFLCDTIIKYDIEFIPPVAEDAKIIRRKAIDHCDKEIRAIYGTHIGDNTRVWAEREVKPSHRFYYADHKSIVLKFGQKLRVQDLELQYKKNIQGILLKRLLLTSGLQRFGRGHFDMNKQARIPIHGTSHKFPKNLSLLPGYRTSLETTVSGVRLGIDTCHRLLEDRTVQELMDSYRSEIEKDQQNNNRPRQWIDNAIHRLTEEKLYNRHIQLFTNAKLYRVDRIDWDLNINSAIPNNPDNITIKDHWLQQYTVDLKCEDFGIIIHYSKLKKNEQRQQVQFIPPEICCLTGVSPEHRNQRNVTTSISKATKIPAFYRMKSTNKLVRQFQRLTVKNQDLRKFIEIPKAETDCIGGQVLVCPNILLRRSKMDFMKTGPEMLQFDWKKCTFVEKGHPIKHWAIAYNAEEEESVAPFISSLKVYAGDGGFEQAINEHTCQYIRIANNDKWTWKNTLGQAIDDINERNRRGGSGQLLRCLIAIIPSRVAQRITDRIYQQIKQVCSTERAILSQCILAKHTSKNHVITGVLRQLLVKLGSIPWKIEFNLPFKRLDVVHTPTMIVGVNINHAQKCNASVVGFAASFDRDFVRYFSLVIHQKQGNGYIAKHDLKPVIEQSLDNFHKINACYPTQIVVFRDGISETQIEECYNVELAAFREVMAQMLLVHNHSMKLEFIAVQKRVNARFLISNNLQSAPPGTAINDVVVSNQFWDFYLVPSKPPPKCVAIPTRCIVIADDLALSDENGEGEMDLMHFTNALCTLYFNWPGPTRVPAPIKYAQKIAQQYCQTLPQKHPHHLLYNSYHFL